MAKPTQQNPFFCLLGAPPANLNLGVAALAHALVDLIHTARPKAEICFIQGAKKSGEYDFIIGEETVRARMMNFRLSPRSRLREHLLVIFAGALLHRVLPIASLRRWLRRAIPILDALARADMVGDIRGGDSFSDYYGLRRLLIGSLPALSALLMGRPLIFLPQTFGPFRSSLARWLAGFQLRRAERILCRDANGPLALADWLHSPQVDARASFCPDVAFTLEAHKEASASFEPPLPANGESLIGINLSGLLAAGGYNGRNMFGLQDDYMTTMQRLAERLLADPDAHLLLVPHVLDAVRENDPAACARLRERLDPAIRVRVHLITGQLTASEVKSIIGRCGFFIAPLPFGDQNRR